MDGQLGDRSYVVHDGDVAFVVDPQRDIDRVIDILDEHRVRLTDVFEMGARVTAFRPGHAAIPATL